MSTLYQNIVEAPNPSLWTAYTPTIVTNTTNAIPGAGSTFNCYYLQSGKTLYINMTFTNTSTGTDGSGPYRFSMPTGFTINTTVAPIFDGTNYTGHLGVNYIQVLSASILGTGDCFTYDSTHYYPVLCDGTFASNPFADTWYGVHFNFYMTLNLIIPIL